MASKASKRITSPLAEKLFHNGTQIAEDHEVTFPNLQPVTESISVMGTIDIPLRGLFQDMEFSVKLNGITKHYGEITTPGEMHTFEHRWVDDHIGSDGSQKFVGKKVFLSGLLKSSGAPNTKLGENTELECTYTCIRYKLVDDGKTVIDFDRFAKKCIVNGKNYYEDLDKYLR
jgi:phage tail tube protein FII